MKTDPTKRKQRRADGYSVALRTDGRWEARVTVGYNENGNPKRKSFYGKTRAQVLEEAKRLKMQIDTGGFAPVARDISLEQWLDKWLDEYIRPHREPKTISYYADFCRIHIKPTLGKLPLRKLTAQAVQRLMNDKSASGLKPLTIRGLRATLRSALTQAWKEGLVEQNVAARTSPPKLEQNNPEFLQPNEIAMFLKAAEGHPLEDFFRFALATGLRVGEATGLRWSDVDFDQALVTITGQLQRVDGKLAIKSLKSRSSRRTLPLVGVSLEALRRQRAYHREGAAENPLDLVFLNPDGKPLDQKYIHNHLKAVFSKAGLRMLSFHKLRHTAATLMVAAGVDLHHVKEHLGHSQIALTANLYAHGVSDSQRRAAGTLDAVLTSGKLPG